MDIEAIMRVLELKKAAIVMNALAESMQNEGAKTETKSLVRTISWAANYIEELANKPNSKE